MTLARLYGGSPVVLRLHLDAGNLSFVQAMPSMKPRTLRPSPHPKPGLQQPDSSTK